MNTDRPSVLTGEFWLIIGAGLLDGYLQKHNISIPGLEGSKGPFSSIVSDPAVVDNISQAVQSLGTHLLPISAAAYAWIRTDLKKHAMTTQSGAPDAPKEDH